MFRLLDAIPLICFNLFIYLRALLQLTFYSIPIIMFYSIFIKRMINRVLRDVKARPYMFICGKIYVDVNGVKTTILLHYRSLSALMSRPAIRQDVIYEKVCYRAIKIFLESTSLHRP